MKISEPTRAGVLVRRYKRFLADIRLENDTLLTVHCPNSGSMKGCSTPGSPVIISRSPNPKRKYAWTLEMIKENGVWVGVNTSLTNKLVREALENGTIDRFGVIDSITPEVRISARSRLDFLVRSADREIYIEVKNCSLAENGVALFPDAVTTRGTRHILELEELRANGKEAALIFCIQRADAERFLPAGAIDPVYAKTLSTAWHNGLTVLAYRADVGPYDVSIRHKIPVFDQETH